MKTVTVHLGSETRTATLFRKKNGKGSVYWSPFTGERKFIPKKFKYRPRKESGFNAAGRHGRSISQMEAQLESSKRCPELNALTSPNTGTRTPPRPE
jgi:hypothetical protein